MCQFMPVYRDVIVCEMGIEIGISRGTLELKVPCSTTELAAHRQEFIKPLGVFYWAATNSSKGTPGMKISISSWVKRCFQLPPSRTK